MKHIIITRPEEDYIETAITLKVDGYEPYNLPLTKVIYLSYSDYFCPENPNNLPINFNNYSNYIITSKNAVRSLQFNNIKLVGNIICLDNDYIKYSNITDELNKDPEIHDNFEKCNIIKTGNNAIELLKYLKEHNELLQNCIYIRGDIVTCDLKEKLGIDEVIVYKTEYRTELTEEEKDILNTESIITIFSSKIAEILVAIHNLTDINQLTFVAFSKKITDVLTKAGLTKVHFSDYSSLVSIKEKIIQLTN